MEKVKLGDVCILNPKDKTEDMNMRVSFVPMQAVSEDGKMDISETRNISEVCKGYTSFVENDVLMAKITPCFENGKCAVAKGLVNSKGYGSTEFIVFRPNQDKVTSSWIYYYTISGTFRANCSKNMTGSAGQKRVPKAFVEKQSIPVPSIAEQNDITHQLDLLREIIEKRKEELNLLDDLIKARFVELFGNPEKNPMHWPVIKLSEICDLQNGYAFKSGDYVDESNVYNCRMSNIRPGGGFDAEYHPKYLPNDYWEKYASYQLVDGDVIIAMTDMASDPKILGVPTIVKTCGKKFLLNQRVGKLIFEDDSRLNRVYLMNALGQKYIRMKLASKAGGSTQINVGKPAILDIEIFEPPVIPQDEFAKFVMQVDKSKFERVIIWKRDNIF